MQILPDKIIIVNGRLKMRDGSSLRAYLLDFQKRNKLKDGRAVNVIERKSLKRAMEDARIARHWGA